jgi:hypothetical protein
MIYRFGVPRGGLASFRWGIDNAEVMQVKLKGLVRLIIVLIDT